MGGPEDAACVGQDPQQWDYDTEYAYHLCTGCPLQQPCLSDALTDITASGMRGGLTEDQRRQYRRTGKYMRLRFQLPPNIRRLTKAQEQQRLDLYQQGLSDKDIALTVGATKKSIQEWRKARRLASHVPARHPTGR